jgi:separase
VKDVKSKPPTTTKSHKNSVSQTPSASHVMLNDAMIECFSTLSPKSRDEELEDMVYFILDLYQFHGVPVAIAEVDIDQVVIDLRAVLEEHSNMKRAKEKKVSTRVDVAKGSSIELSTPPRSDDEHFFLVLDKNVQGLPWESMPILRGRSVSRIPGVDFLHDRVAFAKLKREARGQVHKSEDGAAVDASSGYYVLNPSGDLGRTEERFREWSKDMRKMGWDGVIGRPMSELEFVDALRTRDLVVCVDF